jgi:hypothetical protein
VQVFWLFLFYFEAVRLARVALFWFVTNSLSMGLSLNESRRVHTWHLVRLDLGAPNYLHRYIL